MMGCRVHIAADIIEQLTSLNPLVACYKLIKDANT